MPARHFNSPMTSYPALDQPLHPADYFSHRTKYCAIIAVGANLVGNFGGPAASLRHGVSRLNAQGMILVAASGLYETESLGVGRQPRYLNAVIVARCPMPPARALRLFKQIERQAGRRRGRPNAPRPLDLDLIACNGRRIGWASGRTMHRMTSASSTPATARARGWLTLPHPEMHRRRFVLEPLSEILPHWVHPVLRTPVRELLARLPPRRPGEIRRLLDSNWVSCDTLDM